MAHETHAQELAREAREAREYQEGRTPPHAERSTHRPSLQETEGRRPAPASGVFHITQKGSVTPRSSKLPKIGEAPEDIRKVEIPRGGSATFQMVAGTESGLVGAYSVSVVSPTSHITVTGLPGDTLAVGRESETFTLSVADAAALGEATVKIEANDGKTQRVATIHVTVVE